MNLLFGPALRLVFGSADLRPLDITILDERSSADGNGLIESNLFILDETALSEVLLAFFLLLRLIVCDREAEQAKLLIAEQNRKLEEVQKELARAKEEEELKLKETEQESVEAKEMKTKLS